MQAHQIKDQGGDSMRGFIGLCLLITGLSIGAYSHYPGSAQREASLVELTEIVTGAIHKPSELGALTRSAHAAEPKTRPSVNARPSPAPAPRAKLTKGTPFQRRGWFANSNILTTGDDAGASSIAQPSRATAANQPKVRTLSIEERPQLIRSGSVQPKQSGGWRTAIVQVGAAPAKADQNSASLTTKTYAERFQLVKSIQSELKRVGCYWGRVDGVWGKGSKWAMADFMRAVNAALPTQDPDYIQLKLISSQGSKVCGRQKTQTQIAAQTPPPAAGTKWRAKIARADLDKRTNNTGRFTTGALPSQRDVGVTAQRPRPAPLPGRMAVGVLESPPKLVVRATTGQKRVKVSALVQPMADIGREGRRPVAAENADQNAPQRDADRSPQANPFVAEQQSAAKAKRAKALRKASIRKKKRRKYRKRRHRRRSIQSMFMHPLGRR